MAAGYFTAAGGVAADGIARWNGTSWQSLGSVRGVQGLAAHPDTPRARRPGAPPRVDAGRGEVVSARHRLQLHLVALAEHDGSVGAGSDAHLALDLPRAGQVRAHPVRVEALHLPVEGRIDAANASPSLPRPASSQRASSTRASEESTAMAMPRSDQQSTIFHCFVGECSERPPLRGPGGGLNIQRPWAWRARDGAEVGSVLSCSCE